MDQSNHESKLKSSNENIQPQPMDLNANPESNKILNPQPHVPSAEDVTNANYLPEKESEHYQTVEGTDEILNHKFMYTVQGPDQDVSEILVDFPIEDDHPQIYEVAVTTSKSEVNSFSKNALEVTGTEASFETSIPELNANAEVALEASKSSTSMNSDYSVDLETKENIVSSILERFALSNKVPVDYSEFDSTSEQPSPSVQFDLSSTVTETVPKKSKKFVIPKKSASKSDSMNNFLLLKNTKDFEKAYPSLGGSVAANEKTRSLGRRISVGIGSVLGICRKPKKEAQDAEVDKYAPNFTPRDSIELALAQRSGSTTGTETEPFPESSAGAGVGNNKKRWTLPRKLKSWKN